MGFRSIPSIFLPQSKQQPHFTRVSGAGYGKVRKHLSSRSSYSNKVDEKPFIAITQSMIGLERLVVALLHSMAGLNKPVLALL